MNVLPQPFSSPRGFLRRRGAAFAAATALLVVSGGWIVGTASAAPLPGGFPLNPVIDNSTGLPVCDTSDQSPHYIDIRCNTVDSASAYFGSDGTTLGASFVLEEDPTTATNQAPFESVTYVVELGVNGVHVANIGIDAKGTNDTDYVYAACLGSANLHDVNLTNAIAAGTVKVEPDGALYRLTFNVPLADLAPCVTSSSVIAPYFGTSTAGPLDNINKDFFLGNAVDFTPITPPSMTITKTDSPDPVAPGHNITYTLTAKNTATVPIAAFKITDTVTAPLTFVSASTTSAGLTCNNVAAVVCDFSGSLAANGTVVVTVVAGVPANFAGNSVDNTAWVGSPTGTKYDDDTATTTVAALSDPAATPTVQPSVCVGGVASQATYTIIASPGIEYSVAGVGVVTGVNNATPGTTVVVTATATAAGHVASPASFNVVIPAAPGACTVPAATPTVQPSVCVGGVASQATYTIIASPGIEYSVAGVGVVTGVNNATPGTTVVVTATATAAGHVASPASFNVVIPAAPGACTVPAATPTVQPSVCVGGVASQATYTIIASPGIEYSVAGVGVVTGVNNATPGTTVVVTATATAGGGLVGNPASFNVVIPAAPACTVPAATPTVQPSVCVGGVASQATYTIIASPGIEYSVAGVGVVTGVNNATPGTTVVVTATATAGGGLVGNPASFNVVIPAAPGACTTSAGPIDVVQSACVNGAPSMPTYTIPTTAGVDYKIGGVTQVAKTYNAAAGTTVVVTATATGAGKVAVPATFTLVFTAAPTCTVAASAPTVTQSACVAGAPSVPTFTIVPTAGITYSVGGVTVTGTNTATAGSAVTVTATATGAGLVATPGTFALSFTAAPNCPQPPPPPAAADLGIAKTGPAIARPGDTVTYVLTVLNTGGPATGFSVADQAPTDLTVTALSGTGFTCVLASGVCTYTGTLASAATAVVTVVGLVSPSFKGTALANTAVVSPTDATPGDNTSTHTTEIVQPEAQDLGVSKSGPGSAHPGDELVYTVSVTNVKGTPATGFTVTDQLPLGLAFSSAEGTGFACSVAGQTISCTYGGSLTVGNSASFIVRALLDAAFTGKTVANTAVVDPGRSDTDAADNSSTATTDVLPVEVPIGGGGGGGAEASPTPAPVAGDGGGAAAGPAIPFTGAYSREFLQAGVGMLVLGLFLSLVARRRRTETE